MTEFANPDATGRYLEQLGKKENDLHEATRASLLGKHFFHLDYESDIHEMVALHEAFMENKVNKNFGERFAMAISESFLGKVRLVELSATDHDEVPPGGTYKDPYRDLYNWLLHNGVIEKELSPEESNRAFAVKPAGVEVPFGVEERVIITRIRPLLRADMTNESGAPLNFEIVKLSVFAMMKRQLSSLYDRFGVVPGDPWSEPMMQHVEDLLRHSDETRMHRVIHKIRTGYYLESHRTG